MDRTIDTMKLLLKSQVEVINQKFIEVGDAYKEYYSGLFFNADSVNLCTRDGTQLVAKRIFQIEDELKCLIKQYKTSFEEYDRLIHDTTTGGTE